MSFKTAVMPLFRLSECGSLCSIDNNQIGRNDLFQADNNNDLCLCCSKKKSQRSIEFLEFVPTKMLPGSLLLNLPLYVRPTLI